MVNKQLSGLKDFNIRLKDSSGKNKGLIPFVQAANFEFENTKRPIYNFSQEEFQSVAKGKRLVQGVLVLKQSHLNYLSEIKTKVTKNSKGLEERLSKYSEETRAYLTGIIKEIKTNNTTETAPTKSILEKALKLLDFNDYEIILEPSHLKVGGIGFSLKNVNFTKVKNLQELSESGTVYMEFFANWSV